MQQGRCHDLHVSHAGHSDHAAAEYRCRHYAHTSQHLCELAMCALPGLAHHYSRSYASNLLQISSCFGFRKTLDDSLLRVGWYLQADQHWLMK